MEQQPCGVKVSVNEQTEQRWAQGVAVAAAAAMPLGHALLWLSICSCHILLVVSTALSLFYSCKPRERMQINVCRWFADRSLDRW